MQAASGAACARSLPALEGIRAGAARGLGRSAALLAEDEALLSDLAEKARPGCARDGGLDLAALQALPPPLSLRLLLALAEEAPSPIRADGLRRLLHPAFTSGVIELGGGARLVVEGGVVRLLQSS